MEYKQVQTQTLSLGGSPSLVSLELISHLRSLDYPETALKNILRCGEMSSMFLLGSCNCSSYPVQLTINCNKRFCSRCATKRKIKYRKKMKSYLNFFPPSSLYSYKFLTISPQNYDNLEEGLKHIRESFRKFIRRKYIKERVKGGFYVIECSKKGEGWNLHIHAILFSRHLDNKYRGSCSCGQNYLKFDRIGKKFYCASRSCNKIYEGLIHDSKLKREFQASSGRECRVDISQVSSRSRVVNYCLKYISIPKDSFTDSYDFALFIKSTYKERLLSPFGVFTGQHKNSVYESFSKYQKGQKIVCICPKCDSLIKFKFDSEISLLMGMESNPPRESWF